MTEENNGLDERLLTQVQAISRLVIPGVQTEFCRGVPKEGSTNEFSPSTNILIENCLGRTVFASYIHTPYGKNQFRMWLDNRPKMLVPARDHYDRGGSSREGSHWFFEATGLTEPVQSIRDLLTDGWEKKDEYSHRATAILYAKGGFSDE